jgi:hypothetical protein
VSADAPERERPQEERLTYRVGADGRIEGRQDRSASPTPPGILAMLGGADGREGGKAFVVHWAGELERARQRARQRARASQKPKRAVTPLRLALKMRGQILLAADLLSAWNGVPDGETFISGKARSAGHRKIVAALDALDAYLEWERRHIGDLGAPTPTLGQARQAIAEAVTRVAALPVRPRSNPRENVRQWLMDVATELTGLRGSTVDTQSPHEDVGTGAQFAAEVIKRLA